MASGLRPLRDLLANGLLLGRRLLGRLVLPRGRGFWLRVEVRGALADVPPGFALPGSPGACKDAWDEILCKQLDYRHRPCNFVEILPRLDEHQRRK